MKIKLLKVSIITILMLLFTVTAFAGVNPTDEDYSRLCGIYYCYERDGETKQFVKYTKSYHAFSTDFDREFNDKEYYQILSVRKINDVKYRYRIKNLDGGYQYTMDWAFDYDHNTPTLRMYFEDGTSYLMYRE